MKAKTEIVVTEDRILRAIRALEKPFTFGSSEHIEANRLISKLQAIECGQCNAEGKAQDPAKHAARGALIPCPRCHSKKRGYRKSGMFWTGWAKGTTAGVTV